jgi:hypothetical protein
MKPGDLRFTAHLVRTMAYQNSSRSRAPIEIARASPIILLEIVDDVELGRPSCKLWAILTSGGKMYMSSHELSHFTS